MSEGVENTEVSYQWKWYFTDCPCTYIEIVTVKSSELLCVYCTSEHSRTTNKTDVEHCGVDEIMLSLLSMMCFCQSRLLENFLVITCATTRALMFVANRMVFWCDSNLKDVRTYFHKKGGVWPTPISCWCCACCRQDTWLWGAGSRHTSFKVLSLVWRVFLDYTLFWISVALEISYLLH